MSKVREKAQGFTKQVIGEMVDDPLLVEEGKEQQEHADQENAAQEDQPRDVAPKRRDRAPKRRDA